MKTKLAILALVVVCLWGRTASADTITSGNLSFTCQGCGQSGVFVNTAPTAGSFVYDHTTNQLSLTITWDGVRLGFVGRPAESADDFADLISSSPLQVAWFFQCIHSGVFPTAPCDTTDFDLGFHNPAFPAGIPNDFPIALQPSSFGPGTFTNVYDMAGGFVTATDLVTTTTPEPTTVGLLLLGSAFALALRKRDDAS
jgi:hypothetical protein